jgi:hypothetical protein
MSELGWIKVETPEDKAFKILAIVSEFRGYKKWKAAKDALFFDLETFQDVTHYAMVTDLTWLKSVLKFISFFLPRLSFRYFDLKEKEAAIDWLRK